MSDDNYVVVQLGPESIERLARRIAELQAETRALPEPLLSLRELSEKINVPYSTLSKRNLPARRLAGGRKLYLASEVIESLKGGRKSLQRRVR